MAGDILFPPIEQMQDIRNLNGVIPVFGHPLTLAQMLNSLYGIVGKYETYIPIDDVLTGLTNQSEFDIPYPVMRGNEDGKGKLRIDVLGIPTAEGVHEVAFTSSGDAVGVSVDFFQFPGAGQEDVAHAVWRTTGEHIGNGANREPRTMTLTADAQGYETITYIGNANVKVFAIGFVELWEQVGL